MKKLILLELFFLFIATTFRSDNPPGWFQQQLPVNDFINDIFFLDSLKGWIVTNSNGGNDTGYIIGTTNGGNNWEIQFATFIRLYAIQFPDSIVGYTVGTAPPGKVYKTTNAGLSWFNVSTLSARPILDLSFINKDTGWIVSDDIFDGGIFKTTNGGNNWIRQLNETFRPTKLFFLNEDTGWAACNMEDLYRTTNGGANWNLQFTSAFPIESIFFLSGQKGWIRGGPDLSGNGVSYSIDGGFNWISAQGYPGGYDIKFVNDSIGYSGMDGFNITKSVNGGKYWGNQVSPIFNNLSVSAIRSDTLKGWAGGSGMVKTNDGGGMIVSLSNNESEVPDKFILHQNYPNPFNPVTVIRYELTNSSHVKLKVFDIRGKEVAELINQSQITGEYSVDFKDGKLPSGVYLYRIEVLDLKSNEIFTDTKKMILVR